MKNLFGYTRVLAVGDIHGMHEKLITLMEKVQFDPEEDLLVFLGDYVDGGRIPSSACSMFMICSTHPRIP